MERFRIRHPGNASLVRDLTTVLDRGDLFLAHPEAGSLKHEVLILLTGPDGREVEIVGRVKQALAGVGAAIELQAMPGPVAIEIDDWLMQAQEDAASEGDLPPARVEPLEPGEPRGPEVVAPAQAPPARRARASAAAPPPPLPPPVVAPAAARGGAASPLPPPVVAPAPARGGAASPPPPLPAPPPPAPGAPQWHGTLPPHGMESSLPSAAGTPPPRPGLATPAPLPVPVPRGSGRAAAAGQPPPLPAPGAPGPTPAGGRHTPIPRGEPLTPLPGGAQTPIPTGGAQTPLPTGGPPTPLPTGGPQTPIPAGGAQTPLPTGGPPTPQPAPPRTTLSAPSRGGSAVRSADPLPPPPGARAARLAPIGAPGVDTEEELVTSDGIEPGGELITDYSPPTPMPGTFAPAHGPEPYVPELPPPTRPVTLPVNVSRGGSAAPPRPPSRPPPPPAPPTPPPPLPRAHHDDSDAFAIDMDDLPEAPFATPTERPTLQPAPGRDAGAVRGEPAAEGEILDWPSAEEPAPATTPDARAEGRPGPFDAASVTPAQLAGLTVADKMQAALHGGRDVRLALLRETNKTLHLYVLKNPRITKEEIALAARMSSINPDVLAAIAASQEWLAIPGVALSLVKNPKTPTPLAVELVDRLPVNDVRAIAKTGTVRQAILQAARRRVT